MRRFFVCYGSEIDREQADLLRGCIRRTLRATNEDFWVEATPHLSGEELASDVRLRLLDCDAVLALIGPGWSDANAPSTGASGLDDRHETMHCGIATALRVGVPVIPVLINGASLPSVASLPADLQPLSRRRAFALRNKAFKADARRLLKRLTPQRLGRMPRRGYGRPNADHRSWARHLVALPLVGLTAFGTAQIAPQFVQRTLDPHPLAKGTAPSPSPSERSHGLPASTQASASPGISPGRQAMDDAYTIAPGETRALNPESNDAPGLRAPLRITEIDGRPVNVGDVLQLSHGGQLKMTGPALAFTAGPNAGQEEFAYTVVGADGAVAHARVLVSIADVQATAPQSVLQTFRDCSACPNMVVVPPGSFLMGSPPDEAGRYDDEGPQRRVRVKRFAAGIYEVTWNQYEACVAAAACAPVADDGFGKGLTPVTNLSWYEAKAYVQWLSRESGKNYRLLSEAEWEYAARAGARTPFSFGQTISDSQANFDATKIYGDGQAGRQRGTTLPVGAFPPNAFGLFDMHGNVLEWIEDCYAENYASGQPSDGTPFASATCAHRIARGGSWANDASLLRSALRAGDPATARMKNLGLRVARDL